MPRERLKKKVEEELAEEFEEEDYSDEE